jgi:hypothetical protein
MKFKFLKILNNNEFNSNQQKKFIFHIFYVSNKVNKEKKI